MEKLPNVGSRKKCCAFEELYTCLIQAVRQAEISGADSWVPM